MRLHLVCSLAKEAALHDPFASLAFNRPAAPPKSSPPLKNLSPASATGSQQSNHPSPSQAPAFQNALANLQSQNDRKRILVCHRHT